MPPRSDAMVPADVRARFEADRRNALGALRRGADQLDAARERSAMLAADNLLDKALRRLEAGDDAGAHRFVERALDLPTGDAFEGLSTGSMTARLKVWHVLRTAALGPADPAWIDRASRVLGTLHGAARAEWRRALHIVAEDLDGDAAARVADLEGTPHEGDLDTVTDPAERSATILGMLRAVVAFRGEAG